MLFLSLGMSHQAHGSYLCTQTKEEMIEYWISCMVKISTRFYFRLLLRSTPLLWQQCWKTRPVFCGMLGYVQVQNKWPHLLVLICLYDFIFFFNWFRHARKCLICTHIEQRCFGHQPFEVCGRFSLLDNMHVVTRLWMIWLGPGVRGRQLCGLSFLGLWLTIFRQLGSSDWVRKWSDFDSHHHFLEYKRRRMMYDSNRIY